MHPKVLSAEAWGLISELVEAGVLSGWTLCGGTGLALHFGHRVSEDFDFFKFEDFDVEALVTALAGVDNVAVLSRAVHTLHILQRKVRLSFLRLEAPLGFDGMPYRGLLVGDPRDIATLKLVAIGGRGSRKDFIDLYFYLQQAPGLTNLFELLEARSSSIDWNRYHLLKSLTYFDNAEKEPIPDMLVEIDWEEIKAFFRRQATENL